MVRLNCKRLLLVALILVSTVLLSSPFSLAGVSLSVDWRSSSESALSQSIYTAFSDWAGISLQDVLRDTALFRIVLNNSTAGAERVYLTFGFEVDFDNPNYTDISGAELKFESMLIEGGTSVVLEAWSVDVDVDQLVSDMDDALADFQQGEEPQLPEYLSDITTEDLLKGSWPDVADATAPDLSEDQLTALGISFAGELIRTKQLPAGTYTLRVALYRDSGYPTGDPESWVLVDEESLVTVVKTSGDIKVVSPVEGQLVADGTPTFEWSVPAQLVGHADLEFVVSVKPVGSGDEIVVGTLDMSQVSGSGTAKLEYPDLIDPLAPGSYTWKLVAIDRAKSDTLQSPDLLFGEPVITGFRVNSAPEVVISQQYVVQGSMGDTILEGDMVTFSGAASDSEDGVIAPANLVWSIDDVAVGTGPTLDYSFESAGVYTLQLSAVDSMGIEGSDTLSIVVGENTPPIVTSFEPESGVEVTEGEVVSFSATASDPDRPGQAGITYVWSVEGMDYGYSPTFSFVFGSSSGFGASEEPYVVTLTVYDELGGATTREVLVTVSASSEGSRPEGTGFGAGDELIREIIDSTGGGQAGQSLGQDLFGFIPSFAGTAVIVDDDPGDEPGGDGGASHSVVYISSPRNGEVRYASEMIPFIASTEVIWALDDPNNVVGTGRHFMRLDPGDHVVYVKRESSSGDIMMVAEISVPVELEPETVATIGMIQTSLPGDAVYVGTPSQSAGSLGLYWDRPAVPGMRLTLMQRVRVEGEASVDVVYDDGFIVSVPAMANPHIVDPLEAGLLKGGE